MGKGEKVSVLMLPWLAHGHITPFLELAKKLRAKNMHVYLCSTPVNLTSLQTRISQEYSLSIQLVPLNLPSLPELPPHNHTTNGLPSHLMASLKTAFELSVPAFSDILQTLGPDLVIYDFNQPWAPAVASSINIPAVEFVTTGAMVASFMCHLFQKPDDEFPFPAIRMGGSYKRQILHLMDSPINHVTDRERIEQAVQRSSKMVLFNTFREFEGKYMDYLSSLVQKKIVPVGPLVQDTVLGDNGHEEIMQWLDEKGKLSTVFVSFGSEYFLSKQEMEEIALGLELSEMNFIWVVRFPMGNKTKLEEALPDGFLERSRERGLVVEGWAPQLKILAHSSTCGFVSHCGWNSIMESLKYGVPIIAMPMHLDQPLNGRLVEEAGVAVEVKRDDNGRLNRGAIAQAIRLVAKDKEGENIRIKAREFSENIRTQAESKIDGLVQDLLQLCKETKSLNIRHIYQEKRI